MSITPMNSRIAGFPLSPMRRSMICYAFLTAGTLSACDVVPHPGQSDLAASADSGSAVQCGNFLKDYADELRFDTTMKIGGGTIHIAQTILASQCYSLPKAVLFECDSQSVCTATITICRQQNGRKQCMTVGRGQLNANLAQEDSLLGRFGVPLGIKVEGADAVNHSLSLRLSYSIPYTDIGKAVVMTLHTDDMRVDYTVE